MTSDDGLYSPPDADLPDEDLGDESGSYPIPSTVGESLVAIPHILWQSLRLVGSMTLVATAAFAAVAFLTPQIFVDGEAFREVKVLAMIGACGFSPRHDGLGPWALEKHAR